MSGRSSIFSFRGSKQALAASVLAFSAVCAQAATVSYTVFAKENSLSTQASEGAAPVDTGLFFNLGELLSVSASGSWSPRLGCGFVGPDGGEICGVGAIEPVTGLPYYSLAGRIGSGAWFEIGSSYSQNVTASGRLFLGFVDTDSGNNLGSVVARVTGGTLVVPEPSSAALVLAAVAAWALSQRRKVPAPV